MILRVTSSTILKVAFLCLVIGNSSALTLLKINSIFEGIAYAFLVLLMIKSGRNRFIISISRWMFIMIVSIMLLIGLCIQELDFNIKCRLILSMFLIIFFFFMPKYGMKQFRLEDISYGLAIGIIIDIILSIIFGTDLFSFATEGVGVDFGFNGGLQHKNYYGITCLSIFMCSFLANRIDYRESHKYLIWASVLGLILSNSRTVYLLLFIFVIIVNFDSPMRRIVKQNVSIYYVIFVLFICTLFAIYYFYIQKSESLLIRYSGLFNYLDYLDDYTSLFFGYAEIGFSDEDISYEESVRSIIGWDGTTELSYLSVVLKNGLVGVMAYVLVFLDKLIIITSLKKNKIYSLAVLMVVIFSSFVENYIVNFHIAFMPASMCLLGMLENDA